MFQNERYITRGIQAEIPLLTTVVLWEMIEEARGKIELDYLQIFQLSPILQNGTNMQKIIHTQEQPPYQRTAVIFCDSPVTAKVYCIDDETHSTMLLAEEY